jgi:hypothetical protein
MTDTPLSLPEAAGLLAESLHRETALARVGALPDLVAASDAKAAAFNVFLQSHAAGPPVDVAASRAALKALLEAADENALVLEAVTATLEHAASGLRRTLSAAADPGTYGPTGRGPRHVLAARVDAKV